MPEISAITALIFWTSALRTSSATRGKTTGNVLGFRTFQWGYVPRRHPLSHAPHLPRTKSRPRREGSAPDCRVIFLDQDRRPCRRPSTMAGLRSAPRGLERQSINHFVRDTGRLVRHVFGRNAVYDVLELHGALFLGDNWRCVRIPFTEALAALNFVPFVDTQARPVGHFVERQALCRYWLLSPKFACSVP